MLQKRIPFILMCAVCFFPLLEVRLVSKLVFIFFIISVLFKYNFFFKNLKHNYFKSFLLSSGFYFFLIVSLFYSSDIGQGLKTISKELSFLLVPLFFFNAIQPSKKELIVILKCFVCANFLTSIYLIIYILNFYRNGLEIDFLAIYNEFNFRTIIAKDTLNSWHPAYIGMFNLTSIFILIEDIFITKKISNKIRNSILILLFAIMLILLNSRTVFYCFLLLTPLLIFFKIKALRQRLLFVLIAGIIITGILIYIFSNSSLNYRLLLQLEKLVHWVKTGEIYLSGIDPRYFVYKCNALLLWEAPYFGYGVGDVQYHLNNCYLDNEFFNIYNKGYNVHSIYFFLVLSGGLIPLILFLASSFFNCWMCISKRAFLPLFCFILFLLAGLTENFFVRLNGILFFSFLNTFVLYYNNIIDGLKK